MFEDEEIEFEFEECDNCIKICENCTLYNHHIKKNTPINLTNVVNYVYDKKVEKNHLIN